MVIGISGTRKFLLSHRSLFVIASSHPSRAGATKVAITNAPSRHSPRPRTRVWASAGSDLQVSEFRANLLQWTIAAVGCGRVAVLAPHEPRRQVKH